ncbi:LruC domain-containing protein [Aliagarivorans marinus]|uniref:LruC domain-containing protein n=1 Tax=Aliagarivorans marinus TaxID=561965 RepID=UPI00041E599C|nr:LruC domain-containing protein [Aliagarivorans marinus]
MNIKYAMLAAAIATPQLAYSAAFSSCPTQAFLVQQGTAHLYGVNLATGFYESLSSDMGTTGKLNAMAYNFHDDYLYAWSYEFNTLARIGNDYQVEPLTLDWGSMSHSSFYVGDISLSDNAHYLYRKGATHGLYRVPLDEGASDYLQVERLIDGDSLSLNIFDLAFHPDNGMLYSVDRNGVLWQVDPQSLSYQNLGNVGVSGTFGAVYFDLNGTLYISRNSDGLVFRIDVAAASPQAEQFAQGPSSSNNDGARCAMAPIADDSANIDFGDAPASYGSLLDDNGARHQLVDGAVRLGQDVDGEADAWQYPNSDDNRGLSDDEDGIAFVTGIQAGLDFVVQAQVSGAGYLNGWVDFNRNGVFDDNEQVVTDNWLTEGNHSLLIAAPADAAEGDSWARFRVSSVTGSGASGGAPDGEVEDYEVYISQSSVSISCYPNCQDYATVAFEDNWPAAGDYDLNDLVINLQTRVMSDDNQVERIELRGEVKAVGASFHNGLAIRLPGMSAAQIDEQAIRYEINGEQLSASPIESASSELVVVISEDVREYINPLGECNFYRTQSDCAGVGQLNFKVFLPVSAALPEQQLPAAPYHPFIFATEHQREPVFAQSPGRDLEIHTKNTAPSDMASEQFWGMYQDVSQPQSGNYYQDAQGLPWAIILPYNWRHPLERVNILSAYPGFYLYSNSEGEQAADWYLLENANPEFLYQD